MAFSSLLSDNYQTALTEDLDMFRNRRPADVEIPGDAIQSKGPPGQQINDCPAIGICNGLKYVSTNIHFMQLFDCKYNAVT